MIGEAKPDDLRALLLHMAAASAGAPTERARMVRWFRAGLALLEDEEGDRAAAPVKVTPAVKVALEELATSLTTAAEAADFLADRARINAPPP